MLLLNGVDGNASSRWRNDVLAAAVHGHCALHFMLMSFSISADAPRRRVLADYIATTRAWSIALVVASMLVIAALAQVNYYIPGMPVPFTGQTLGVLLVASAAGSLRGAIATAGYAILGIAGVPWLAGGVAGFPAYTFGYLLGFVAAAALVGWLAERGAARTPWGTLGAMFAGTIVIYAFGVPWLASALGGNWAAAVASGLTPFLLTDALKALIAAALLPSALYLVRRR